MVLSVVGGTVAFTGTVAASTNAHFDNLGGTAGEVTPLNSTTYPDAGTSATRFNISFAGDTTFDGSFQSVKDGNVEVKFFNGNTGNQYAHYQTDAVVQTQTNNYIIIKLQNTQSYNSTRGDYINIFFSDNFKNPENAGTYSGSITVVDNGDVQNGTLNVQQPSAGPGQRTLTQGNETLEEGQTKYIGQKLLSGGDPNRSGNQWESGEDVQLKDSGGSVIATRSANSTGWVLFDTRAIHNDVGLTPGQYFLDGEEPLGTGENVSFRLIRQDLSANFQDDQVEKDGETTLTVNSQNRVNYNISIESPDLSATKIQQIFDATGNADIRNHTEGVDTTIDGNKENLTADFDDISTGNYTFSISVVDTIAKKSDSVEVVPEAGVNADLDKTTYQAPQGDLVRFTVSLSNTKTAKMQVGSDDAGYNATVTLEDGNGDGKVTVIMNTYVAGRRPTTPADESIAYGPADDQDTVTADLETNELDSLIDQGDYLLSTSVGGTEKDVGTLILDERETQSLNVSTAPADLTLSELEDIEEANANGDLTEDTTIAEKDLIVNTVKATGVFGAIANGSGDATEVDGAGLRTMVDQGTISLEMEQSNEDINTKPKEFDLQTSMNQGAVDFIADEDNGTMYLVVDSEDAVFRRGGRNDVFRARSGDKFDALFNVSKNSLLVDEDAEENESVTDSFQMVDREGEFDLDNQGLITVWSPDNTKITGTTTIAPGSEVRVRARATGDSPFLKTTRTDVKADGTFSADFNLSDVEPVANFTATLNGPEQQLDEDDGQVVARPTAKVTMNDQTVQADQPGRQTLVVASVSMNKGGFVTIHDQTLQDGQTFASVRGSSAYLTPGQHSDVQVKLDDNIQESQTVFAMPHRDTDGDTAYTFVQTKGKNDAPYTKPAGGIVTDSASITVETPTPTPPPETPTETPEPTEPPTPTETPTETPTPTEGQTPGFGITVAVISLAAAALLMRRRLN